MPSVPPPPAAAHDPPTGEFALVPIPTEGSDLLEAVDVLEDPKNVPPDEQPPPLPDAMDSTYNRAVALPPPLPPPAYSLTAVVATMPDEDGARPPSRPPFSLSAVMAALPATAEPATAEPDEDDMDRAAMAAMPVPSFSNFALHPEDEPDLPGADPRQSDASEPPDDLSIAPMADPVDSAPATIPPGLLVPPQVSEPDDAPMAQPVDESDTSDLPPPMAFPVNESAVREMPEPATLSYSGTPVSLPQSIVGHSSVAPEPPEESSVAPELQRSAGPAVPGENPLSLVMPENAAETPSGAGRQRSSAFLSTVYPSGPAADPTAEYERIDEYKVLRKLGEGGMGVVYEVDDEPLGRRLALKLMKRNQAADPDARARFLREARAMAALTHDHITPVYNIGEHDGLPYLTMPVLVGMTLETKLSTNQPLAVKDAVRIARQIARALTAAHAVGLIHRDVKPANVWLEFTSDGAFKRVRLLDFGLARSVETALGPSVTRPQQMIGTPAYMAPEQVDGRAVDHRADLFGVGAVLYQMLTGLRPFPGDTVFEVLQLVVHHTPKPAADLNPQVPLAVSKLVERLMHKDTAKRPQSAAEVVRELWNILGPEGQGPTDAKKKTEPPPKKVGDYQIVREIGRGSTGIVYEAIHPKDGRRMALKLQFPTAEANAQTRFRRTARNLREVDHQCVVPVDDVARAGGPQYYTMPLLLGRTLKERLAAPRPIPLAVGVQIARQIARGLAAVHFENLGHQALRPSNVWLEANPAGKVGGVRIMDVGLADPMPSGGMVYDTSQSGRHIAPNQNSPADEAEPAVPVYLAPEQVWGQEIDHRADLFSLGCILYELATGAPAFAGPTAQSAVQAVLNDFPPAVHRINPAVPPRLASLIARMLAKDPTARPSDALLVARELANCLHVPAPSPPEDGPTAPPEWRKTYTVVREFSRTTIGMIYEVTDARFGQQHCILEAAESVARDSAARDAFVRAAKQMAALEHAYIVSVLGVGEYDRQPYLVLPLLPGRSLKARLMADGVIPVPEAAHIAAQTAGALAAAHARGVIHGSVKPSNLWLVPGKDGSFRRVRVFDVGLARAVSEAAPGTWFAPGSIAPEQVRGYPADDRTDLFGLGATLYEMVTGVKPFDGANVADVLDAVMRRDPEPAMDVNPQVPEKLSDLIGGLLRKDPADRPDAATDVARELAAWAGPLARSSE